jgi:hypothetical protein
MKAWKRRLESAQIHITGAGEDGRSNGETGSDKYVAVSRCLR